MATSVTSNPMAMEEAGKPGAVAAAAAANAKQPGKAKANPLEDHLPQDQRTRHAILALAACAAFLFLLVIIALGVGGSGPGSGSIEAGTLAPGSVANVDIQGGAVTADKVGAEAITSAALQDGAVVTDAIAAGAVTADKLLTGAVTGDSLASGAVGSAAIASAAVTSSALADGAVTSSALADGAVTTAKVQAQQITTALLADGAVDTGKLATSVPLAPTPFTKFASVAKVDTTSDIIRGAKLVVRHNGLPAVIYSAAESPDVVYVAVCGTVDCTSVTATRKLATAPSSDTIGYGGLDAMIAYDGSLLVTYETASKLMFVRATGADFETIASPVQVGSGSSISVPRLLLAAQSNTMYVYRPSQLASSPMEVVFVWGDGGTIRSSYCSALACTSPSSQVTIVSQSSNFEDIEVVQSRNGWVVINTARADGNVVQYVCNNVRCSSSGSAYTYTIATGTSTGTYGQAIGVGTNMAYYPVLLWAEGSSSTKTLYAQSCNNWRCSTTKTKITIDSVTDGGVKAAITAPSGDMMVFYTDSAGLKRSLCNSMFCDGSVVVTDWVTSLDPSVELSVTLGADRNPVLAFVVDRDVWVMHCADPYCLRMAA